MSKDIQIRNLDHPAGKEMDRRIKKALSDAEVAPDDLLPEEANILIKAIYDSMVLELLWDIRSNTSDALPFPS